MGSYVKTEQFLDLYKRLEKTGRKHFPRLPENAPIINKLCEIATLRPSKDDIEYCRTVRNFLVHTPKIKNMYPVIPSDEMIELLKTPPNINITEINNLRNHSIQYLKRNLGID